MNSHQRTRRQVVVERRFRRPLPDVIDWLLHEQDLTHEQAAKELKIDQATFWRWRRQLASESQPHPTPSQEEPVNAA